MKRDMDLVRRILIAAEAADGRVSLGEIESYGCDAATAAFHIELMKSHGLVEAKVHYAMGGEPVDGEVTRLTWDGCDYLDAIRSNRVWERAKSAVSDAVGDTSLSVMKETCTALALSMIKSSLGI